MKGLRGIWGRWFLPLRRGTACRTVLSGPRFPGRRCGPRRQFHAHLLDAAGHGFGHRADAGPRGRARGPRHPRAGRCPGRGRQMAGGNHADAEKERGGEGAPERRRGKAATHRFASLLPVSAGPVVCLPAPMAAGPVPQIHLGRGRSASARRHWEAASGRGRSSIWRRERPKSCSRPAPSRSSADRPNWKSTRPTAFAS